MWDEEQPTLSCLCFILTITLGGSATHLLVHTERVLRVWVHGARVKSRVGVSSA